MAQYNQDNRKSLYNQLTNDGYDLGDFNSFNENLNDSTKRRNLYDAITQDNYDVGSYESFSSNLDKPSSRVGSVAQQVIDEYDESMRNGVQNDNQKKSLPTLEERVNPSQFALVEDVQQMWSGDRNDAAFIQSQKNKSIDDLYKSGAFESFSHRDEESQLDKTFTPRPVENEADIYYNYKDRFPLTKRGEQLYGEYGSKSEEVRGKYLKEFEKTPEYKEIASGRYKTQEEVDAANKKMNDLFIQRYGSQIEKELKPYSDALNDEMYSRYENKIKEDFRQLGKKETKEQLDSLVSEVDELDTKLRNNAEKRKNAYNGYAYYTPEEAKEQNILRSVRSLIDNSKDIIAEAGKKGTTNFVSGLSRGVGDVVFDADTWSFGISDVLNGKYLLTALQKADKGEKLSPAEEKLLEASSVNMIVNAYYSQDLGRGYKAGQTTAQSLPFMLEFVANPISASGSSIAKSLLRFGIKKFGKNAMKKAASKAGARLIGDAAAAAGMTLTTGQARVAGGSMDRLAQNYNYGFDDNGDLKVEKVGDTFTGSAIARSAASTFLENQSEMVFNAFRGASPLLQKANEVLPDGINGMFNRIKNSRVGQLYKELKNNPTFKELAERTQFRGIGEEYMEEVYNNFANIPLGEMTFEDAIDLDNNIDTFLGLAPTSIAFSMLGLGSLARERYGNRRRMKQLISSMDENQRKKLEELQAMGSSNDVIASFLKQTIYDGNITPEQKRNAIEFCYELAIQNAIDEVSEAETQDKIEKETQSIINSSDPQTNTYTEMNRYVTNELGERIEVPGYVVGYMSGRPLWIPEGAAEGVSPIPLKDGEYNPESVKSMPTQEVIDETASAIRENDKIQAEKESNYSPEILPYKSLYPGASFSDANGNAYQVVNKDVDSNEFIVSITSPEGELLQNRPISEKEYLDIMQSNINMSENASQQPAKVDNVSKNKVENAISPSGQESKMSNGRQKKEIDDIRNAGASEEAITATINARFSSAKRNLDKAKKNINAPFRPGVNPTQEIEMRKSALENAQAEYDAWKSLLPASSVEEQEQTDVETIQQNEIPTDDKGNLLYYRAPVDVTVRDINSQLEPDEVDLFVSENKKEAEKELKSVENKKPKVGTNIEKYKKEKQAWQELMSEAQAKADYWNDVDSEIKRMRTNVGQDVADEVMGFQEPVDGHELAAQMLASGKLPILIDEYMKETGYSSSEAKKMFGLFRTKENGGMTIEKAGEQLMLADREAGTNFFDQSDPNAGRNAIIDVFSQVKTRGDLTNYIKQRREAIARRESEAEYNAYSQWVEDNFHMSVEDYEAYMERIEIENPYDGVDNNELDAIFADAAEEYEQSINNEQYGREQETGIDETTEGGNSVLPEQQSDNQGTDTAGAERGKTAGTGSTVGRNDESTQASEIKQGENILDFAERVVKEKEISDARKEVDTNPTDAQKEAGNYKKGHVNIDGLDITIENPKGSTRNGVDANGNTWSITMQNDYGYIRGTKAVDGDHIDIFLSDNPTTGNVFVVDAIDQQTGEFDESKVMYGFNSMEEARDAYLSNYSPGWKVGPITEVSKDEFKKWIESSTEKRKAFSEYKSVKEIGAQNEENNSIQESIENNENESNENPYNSKDEFINDAKADLINTPRPSESDLPALKKIANKALDKGNEKYTREESRGYKSDHATLSGLYQSEKKLLNKYGDVSWVDETEGVVYNIGYYPAQYKGRPDLIRVSKEYFEDPTTKKRKAENSKNKTSQNSTSNNDVRFRFIGEQGATNLDRAEEATTRLDNLSVARDMEEDGKDAKSIKLATGWERGADGKWRYETSDFEYYPNGDARKDKLIENRPWYNEYMTLVKKLLDGETLTEKEQARYDELYEKERKAKQQYEDTEKVYLDDYVKDDELFNAYPELKQTKVLFVNKSNGEAGSYLEKDNTITININSEIETRSILAHEIQHAIQRIEGFAVGGSPNTPYTFNQSNILPKIEEANVFIEKYGDNFLKKARENSDADFSNGSIFILKMIGRNKRKMSAEEGRAALMKLYAEKGDVRALGLSGYKRLSGEVEARNVQSRLGMTEEERRNSLASETEDVAREDQIFLYDSLTSNLETENANKEIESTITELSNKLNTPIRIINSLDEITNTAARNAIEKGRGIKAWFEPSTGEVVIYLPNATSVNDVKRSVLHEVVGHKGLREIIGAERYDNEMIRLFGELPISVRKEVSKQAISEYNGNVAIAMDEYLAEQAELDETPSWWEKVMSVIRDMLRNIGINVELTNGDVKYLLWRSRKNLEDVNALDIAEDISMRDRNGIYPKPQYRENESFASNEVREKRANDIADILRKRGFFAGVSKSRNPFGNSDYVTVYSPDFRQVAKIRLSDHSVTNTGRILDEYHVREDQTAEDVVNDLFGNLDATAFREIGNNEDEIRSIIEKAQKDGTYMKAPNGKPTNLTERQWAQVRTRAFKNWFGDWENDPDNASKVVDENGEPKVVYHGSSKWFTVFNSGNVYHQSKAPNNSVFSTDNIEVANSYIAGNWYGESAGEKSKMASDVYLDENDQRHKRFSWGIYREGGIYPLFMNLKNPLIIDFNGKAWNDLSINGKDINEIVSDEILLRKHDGVLAKNIIDVGLTDLPLEELPVTNDYVSFSSNQVKSATENTGEFDPTNPDIRFRTNDGTIKDYENEVDNWKFKAQEAYQDSMLSLKKLQEIIEKKYGIKLKSHENAYMAENQMSSKSTRETEVYGENFFKPMINEVAKLVEKGISYEDVKKYVMAKHGLERNEDFASRDAKNVANEEFKPLYEEAKTNYDNGKISDTDYYNRIDELDELRSAREDELYNKNRKGDYSGLSDLFKDEKDYEEAAKKFVEQFEEDNNTDEFWEKINSATKETLRKAYESGIISKQVYEKVKNQFKYYVPLRGWKEDTAEDIYQYINSKDSSFSSAVKKANRRTSVADDPFATIGNMAESTILQGNRNLMKQKFLNMAINHPSDILTVSKVWYVKDPNNGNWMLSVPDIQEGDSADVIAEKIENHKKRMLEYAKTGDAKQSKSKLDIDYKINKYNAKEHTVIVKMNGEDYVVFVNGNPRAAQAVNGMTNPDAEQNKIFNGISMLNRWMAANFTTRNPAFVLSNLSRDLIFSMSAVAVKEDAAYVRAFAKNIPSTMEAIARGLKGKDAKTETDRYFQEFLDNGGETGYTALHNVDEYKKMVEVQLKKAMNKKDYFKAVRATAGWFSNMNRWAEDVARFNAYQTSRQMGRSITESINDAKEITVNFNKKGAGYKTGGFFGITAGIFRNLYLFFNAAVQSLNNFAKLAKKNKKGFISLLGGFTTAGFMVPFLNSIAISMMGGDDDYYANLPEWVRRNNLCLYVGNGQFITIPLPIELRAFYGLGEMAYQATIGRDKYASENVAYAAINQVTELLPINPLGNQGDLVTTIIPDAIKPLWQIHTNKDFTGIPIYKDSPFNENMPEWTKAYKGTSSVLVDLSKWTNEIAGGDNYKKADTFEPIMNWNPAKVESLFESYFGGMSTTVNQTAKFLSGIVMSAIEGKVEGNLQVRNVPILNRFWNDASDDRSSFRNINQKYYQYYDIYEEVGRLNSKYSMEIGRGNLEYLDKLKELYKTDDFKIYNMFKINKSVIDKIKKTEKLLPEDSSEEKEKIQDAINKMKKDLVDSVMEMEK